MARTGGSLRLSTLTGGEKVFALNYQHVGTALSTVDDIGYATYRTAGSAQQSTALNLQVDGNGAADGGFTTLVFEPVHNTDRADCKNGGYTRFMYPVYRNQGDCVSDHVGRR